MGINRDTGGVGFWFWSDKIIGGIAVAGNSHNFVAGLFKITPYSVDDF